MTKTKPEATTASEDAGNVTSDRMERAKAILQNATNDLTRRLADHPSRSFPHRVANAYRAGVPAETLEAALSAVESAAADARAAYERIVAVPPEKATREKPDLPTRVTL